MVEQSFGRVMEDARGVMARLQESVALVEALCLMLEKMSEVPHESADVDGADQVGTHPNHCAEGAREGIQVYWIGCAGLQRAARRLGPEVRIDRIGTSTEPDLVDRLSAAAADAYGSWTRDGGGRLVQEPGFTAWMMQTIRTTRGSTDPAITVKTRSIAVALPEGLSRRSFDRALHVALEGWGLARAHPGAQRFTNYSVGVDRMSRAIELYTGLDPRSDGDRLLAMVEGILATHRARRPRTEAAAVPSQPSLLPDAQPSPVPKPRRRMSPIQIKAMQARLASGTRRCGAS